MEFVEDRLLLAASDLIDHLECAHLTRLNLGVASGALALEATRTAAADLVASMGDKHEAAYLESLRADGRDVAAIDVRPGPEGLRAGAAQTLDAMRRGAEVIYQAVLFDGGRWRGYADFLERRERASALGAWSYEVADTKLARRVKPYFLLQLCLYSELLAATQGLFPERIHVVLGSRARESFRLAEFSAYARRVKHHFEEVLARGANGTYPHPVEHCGVCRWSNHCDAQRERDDHLSLVANMRRDQSTGSRPRGSRPWTSSRAPNPARGPCAWGHTRSRRCARRRGSRPPGARPASTATSSCRPRMAAA